jgi:hypothetical protein
MRLQQCKTIRPVSNGKLADCLHTQNNIPQETCLEFVHSRCMNIENGRETSFHQTKPGSFG